MPFLIALYVCLLSHLQGSKNFEDGQKVVAYAVFIIIGLLYLLFKIVF